MAGRIGKIKRETAETVVKAEWDLDGTGTYDITTGQRMLDHLVSQVARHGVFDIKLSATGSDLHHVTEDCALCLGKAFAKALGNKEGIVRYGSAIVPMDDALAMVAVDLGGRPYTSVDVPLSGTDISGLPVEMLRHFMVSLASEGRFNLHVKLLDGIDDHHKAEAVFKALGRALDMATRIDPRLEGRIPSTKEIIE